MSDVLPSAPKLPDGCFFCTETGEKVIVSSANDTLQFIIENATWDNYSIPLSEEQFLALQAAKARTNIEIEQKFLVNHLPENIETYPYTLMEQCYLVIWDKDEVRIREEMKDGRPYCTLTIKSGNGTVRGEFETFLTPGQYRALKRHSIGTRIQKFRFRISYDSRIIELDVYFHELSGNAVVEVEFASIQDMENFKIPDWFGTDVSEVNALKNKNLALNGFPEWLYSEAQLGQIRDLVMSILEKMA